MSKPRPRGRGLRRPEGANLWSEPIEYLVGPEPFEAVQRLVQRREFLGADAAELLDGAHVLLVERLDDGADVAALLGKFDAHRPAVDPRALVIEESHLHELLQIVGHVRA